MNHERLQCYQLLKETAKVVHQEIKRWPRGYGELEDQLKRALIFGDVEPDGGEHEEIHKRKAAVL